MNIHEYQAKAILKKYGVPVPEGRVASTSAEAYEFAVQVGSPQVGSPVCVVKSQIHAGGRGKGRIFAAQDVGVEGRLPLLEGGVKVCRSPDEAKMIAGKILGNFLVTHQSGPSGRKVKKVLIEQGISITKEYYLGLVLDRASSRVTVMASTEGGMEIEKVATAAPDKILKETIDPAVGLLSYQGRNLGFKLGLDKVHVNQFAKFVASLYQCFIQADCSIVEINPLVLTAEGKFLAVDAKINFDDNALYRHPDYEALRDLAEENPLETEAKKHDLSYISLDGNIGCMVNGAGLAMATMDIIKLYGGAPANFLDVGGGATKEKVTAAFKIILSDVKVTAILVNIFGGIMKCDVIAAGVVAAVKEVGLSMPLVVRLQGTNVDQGKKILAESGFAIISADTMAEAAQKVVSAVK